MSNVIPFLTANYKWILALVSLILFNLGNGLKDYPTLASRLLWVHALLDRLSIVTNANSPRTFKMLGTRSKPPVGKTVVSGVIGAPVAALLPFLLLLSASCSCFTPATRNTPQCVILNNIIDCSEDVVIANLGPAVSKIIQSYIAAPNQSPNWTALDAALEAAGIKDGGCIIAQLQADFLGAVKADPAYAASVKDAAVAFNAYKARHGLSKVQYRVKSGGKVVVL